MINNRLLQAFVITKFFETSESLMSQKVKQLNSTANIGEALIILHHLISCKPEQ